MAELKNLKKLSPEERIKRLKELEDERKKEIEEAEKMIKESQDEIQHQRELKSKVPIPQVAAIDVDALFSQEEKEIFKVSHGEGPRRVVEEVVKKPVKEKPENLEEAVGDAPQPLPEEDSNRAYQIHLAEESMREMKTSDIYNTIKDMATGADLNEEQRNAAYAAYNVMKEREDQRSKGMYGKIDDRRLDKQISKVFGLIESIQSSYKR
jgi:hypothetical protein